MDGLRWAVGGKANKPAHCSRWRGLGPSLRPLRPEGEFGQKRKNWCMERLRDERAGNGALRFLPVPQDGAALLAGTSFLAEVGILLLPAGQDRLLLLPVAVIETDRRSWPEPAEQSWSGRIASKRTSGGGGPTITSTSQGTDGSASVSYQSNRSSLMSKERNGAVSTVGQTSRPCRLDSCQRGCSRQSGPHRAKPVISGSPWRRIACASSCLPSDASVLRLTSLSVAAVQLDRDRQLPPQSQIEKLDDD